MVTEKQIENAKEIVAYYTLAAAATGAIPVPASSAAIIAENCAVIGTLLQAAMETIGLFSLHRHDFGFWIRFHPVLGGHDARFGTADYIFAVLNW